MDRETYYGVGKFKKICVAVNVSPKLCKILIDDGTDGGVISSGRRDNFSRSAVCESCHREPQQISTPAHINRAVAPDAANCERILR